MEYYNILISFKYYSELRVIITIIFYLITYKTILN